MPRQHPYGGYDSGGKRPRRENGRFFRGRGRGGRSGHAHMPYAMPYGGGHGMSGAPFPPWGAPFTMMPMPYGMPNMWYGMPSAALPPQPEPWDAMHPPYATRGRGGARAERKSQRPRFTRSIYQPDPEAERPEDSKPCRTLFVRNVAFEVNVNALRAEFASYGEIRTWFDLIQRRGMLFVTYYDTRAAERARVEMNKKVLVGRALDVHFSLPKDEDQEQHCDRDKNQGTLFVIVHHTTEPVSDEAIRTRFEPFGDIRAIRTYKDQSHTRFIEYWDSRACIQAHDTCQDTEFLGGKLQLKFAWDLSTVSLVNDARSRSEAKAAAEARANANQQDPAPLPEEESAQLAPAWPATASEERLEQAQKVQQARISPSNSSF